MTPDGAAGVRYARLRIVSGNAKFAYVFLAGVGALMLLMLAMGLGTWVGTLSAIPLHLLVVGYAVRNFRDAEIEPVAPPREWWRMTARPTSGYVVGTLYVLQGGSVALTAFQRPEPWALLLGAVVQVLLGVAFLRSSVRLRRDPIGQLPPSSRS